MDTKIMILVIFVFSFIPGESFYLPRPQFIELSQNERFQNLLLNFFGVRKDGNDQELKPKTSQILPQRERIHCLHIVNSMANYNSDLQWMKKLCFMKH